MATKSATAHADDFNRNALLQIIERCDLAVKYSANMTSLEMIAFRDVSSGLRAILSRQTPVQPAKYETCGRTDRDAEGS